MGRLVRAAAVTGEAAVVLVREINKNLDDDERRALYNWAVQMLAVRASPRRRVAKAVAAVRLTSNRTVLKPILLEFRSRLAAIGVESKRLLWDERRWAARFGMGGVLGAAAVVGGQGAGIAALGGAIGVPLWLLGGAGGTVLGAVVDELEGFVTNPDSDPEDLGVDWDEIDRLLDDSSRGSDGDEIHPAE